MTQDLVRFEDFELDPRAYQVRRSGRTLKLERIPMEVLLLLAERRGQLVTREEIIEKLWGKDVFLDTDNAINTAIRKIRQVLKDDPEQPRFVQTDHREGYRFIGLVISGTEAAFRRKLLSARRKDWQSATGYRKTLVVDCCRYRGCARACTGGLPLFSPRTKTH